MPSTYTVNLGIEKPATGEQSGTWGDTTNTNFDILDQAINGAVRVTLTSAGTSSSPNQLQITNGAASDGRNKWIEIYSASDLGGSAYLQLDPNDAEKILFIRNSLAGSQSILLFQGTYNSGRDLEVPAGVDMVVKFDGGGASAATVTDVYTKLRVTELTTPTLTATTADINGGTLDNSVIGGTTAAAITGTTITANTSLNIAGDGATVTGIKDEDDMSSNSPTKLATQQSIKAYVDSQVGTVDTWAEVLANGATSGSTNPEVTAGQALKTNTINETSAGSGVTIDSVLLKDDVVNATDIEVSSISANDGTEAATLANSTGVMTIASSVLTTTDINGGSIDGTNIGASTPGTGAFTTLSTTGLTSMGADLTITDASPAITLSDTSVTNLEHKINSSSDNLTLRADVNDVDAGNRVEIFVTNQSSVRFNKGSTVFNEGSADVDFRIESDSNANMFFVDGGANKVAVGTNSPQQLLHLSSSAITYMRATGGSSNTGIDFGQHSNASGYIWHRDDAAVIIGTNETERVRFGSSTAGETVFNEGSNDWDFRVESNNQENMLFIDGGNDRVMMGTSTYAGKILTVRGGASSEGMSQFYQDVATNYPTLTIKQRGQGGNSNDPQGLSIDVAGHNDGLGKIIHTNTINTNFNGGVAVEPFTVWNDGAFQFRLGGVVNENGQSTNRADFRVESNSYSHMLFVDAGLNRVGINENNPEFPFHVNGGTLNNTSRFESSDATTLIQTKDSGGVVAFGNTGATFIVQPNLSYSVIEASQGSVVINNAGQDTDFRVEGDNKTHMIFVDASTDKMALGGDSYASDSTINAKNATFGLSIDDVNPDTHAYGVLGTTRSAPTSGTVKTHMTLTTAGQVVRGLGLDAGGSLTLGSATTNKLFNLSNQTLSVAGDAVIVNEHSTAHDFRVESNSQTHCLFVDGGNNRVGINNANPGAQFDVNGGARVYAGSLTLGSSSSDPGIILLNDNSTTAYTLAFKGTGTRVYAIEGSASSGQYTLNLSNAGTGLFALDVAGYGVFKQTAATGATVTIGGHQDGRLIDFQSGGSTRFYLYGGGTGDDQLSFYESNGHAMINMYDAGGVVINEDQQTQDFRVESNVNSHMLFVDASAESVSIGTSDASGRLNLQDVNGEMSLYGSGFMSHFKQIFLTNASGNAKTITITLNTHSLEPAMCEIHAGGYYYNNGNNTFYRHTKYYLMRESSGTARINTRVDEFLGGSQTGVIGVPSITYASNEWTITMSLDAGYVAEVGVYLSGPGANKILTLTAPDQ